MALSMHTPRMSGLSSSQMRRSALGGRACPVASRRLVVSNVSQVTQSNFETEVLKSDVPVLVDFWAPWCGPCKLVAPLMDFIEKEYKGGLKVVKVEHDPNPELIAKYKVYGLAAIMLFKDGKDLQKREGAISKAQLQAWLKQHMAAPA